MSKKINPNLTEEQQSVLFEEGTELAGTSELNHEKREGSFHCANCEKNCLILIQNMKAGLVGLHFINHYLMYLKLKQIII